MSRLAEVWRKKIVHRPSRVPRTSEATCEVMSCSPCPGVSKLNCLTIRPGFERGHRRQLLALEELQERAAGGRDVADALVDLELVDRGDGVAAAGDGERLGAGDRLGQHLGAFGERLLLEHADRAVPYDGAGFFQRRRQR